MSVVKIRAALETALNSMTPSLSTAWENAPFSPTTGTPFQSVRLLFAEPENREISPSYRELGYMQIALCYPPQSGPKAAADRAELLRSTFKRGATFTSGGVSVTVSNTPEVLPGAVEDGFYIVRVNIRFFANITVI